MKKTIIISSLMVLTLISWLLLRPSKFAPTKIDQPTSAPQATNVEQTTLVPVAAPSVISTNVFIRPDSMNEETWKGFMQYRRIVLEANQPVEFYARVLDQNEHPIAGAKLAVKLARTDESMFANTNYYQWDAGRALQNNYFDLFSDVNGWIQITETNGSFLDMVSLTKEGYLSGYPTGGFGGVHYEPRGVRGRANLFL